MSLCGIGRIAARIDQRDKQRARDSGDLIRPGSGQVGIVDGDGLAQIGQD